MLLEDWTFSGIQNIAWRCFFYQQLLNVADVKMVLSGMRELMNFQSFLMKRAHNMFAARNYEAVPGCTMTTAGLYDDHSWT